MMCSRGGYGSLLHAMSSNSDTDWWCSQMKKDWRKAKFVAGNFSTFGWELKVRHEWEKSNLIPVLCFSRY
jgi:hypothetical protein